MTWRASRPPTTALGSCPRGGDMSRMALVMTLLCLAAASARAQDPVKVDAQDARFTLPGGKTVERRAAAGEAQWTPAETHLPENLSDQPLELILVELKAKPGAGHGK